MCTGLKLLIFTLGMIAQTFSLSSREKRYNPFLNMPPSDQDKNSLQIDEKVKGIYNMLPHIIHPENSLSDLCACMQLYVSFRYWLQIRPLHYFFSFSLP